MNEHASAIRNQHTEFEALENGPSSVPRETEAHNRAALAQHLHGALVVERHERRVVNLLGMTRQSKNVLVSTSQCKIHYAHDERGVQRSDARVRIFTDVIRFSHRW